MLWGAPVAMQKVEWEDDEDEDDDTPSVMTFFRKVNHMLCFDNRLHYDELLMALLRNTPTRLLAARDAR